MRQNQIQALLRAVKAEGYDVREVRATGDGVRVFVGSEEKAEELSPAQRWFQQQRDAG